ncbi:hypothetical protein T11_7313 [Trichinella zimbabwensis]|uniref:Uncharacterized protein n=1 Tax=Trichinella zimbabwensis TaxID=268475 RepID=A0A0V1I0J6_9BILA|nr:hypothetical protein T11_7313 [Trichinella zimbabwensis]
MLVEKCIDSELYFFPTNLTAMNQSLAGNIVQAFIFTVKRIPLTDNCTVKLLNLFGQVRKAD